MTVNYRSGDGVWAFKTAYRDELAKFSPGVLVEIEGTIAALDDPSIAWVDSCSSDDTGLMGELWPDRRQVVDLLVSTQPLSNGVVAAASAVWRTYVSTKNSARSSFVGLRRARPTSAR
jgi:hypothetical protein